MTNKVISHEWILPQLQAENWQEVIIALGNLLSEHGFVKDSYVPAVLVREKIYPTGLPLGAINVAIPHTDTGHVNHPAIAMATLAKPVLFGNMGEPGGELEVRVVFLLAMKDPRAQLGILQNLVAIFQDDDVLNWLSRAEKADEIEAILIEHLILEEVSLLKLCPHKNGRIYFPVPHIGFDGAFLFTAKAWIAAKS
jgi:PTS system galactitol-specific IIA component